MIQNARGNRIGMAYWLGDSESAHTVDRVMQETLGSSSKSNNGPPSQDLCSTIVPKCLAESLRSSSSERRLNPLVMMTPSLLGMESHGHKKRMTNEFVE
jgi:hypothetical protein